MNPCVILPTYNEAGNIGRVIESIREHAPAAAILVVDDNSPDGTADQVRQLQPQQPALSLLVRTAGRGFAQSYLAGFRHALEQPGLTHVVTMDADLSHDARYLPRMLEAAREHDVVIGSRYAAGGGTEGWEAWRRVLSRCANWYCRGITRMPVRDCTAGFSVIRIDALRRIPFERIDAAGYAFLMELKYRLGQNGAQFAEVPIVFRNRDAGESKLSARIVREGLAAPWRLRLGRATL